MLIHGGSLHGGNLTAENPTSPEKNLALAQHESRCGEHLDSGKNLHYAE
jgi:hypothetical protein